MIKNNFTKKNIIKHDNSRFSILSFNIFNRWCKNFNDSIPIINADILCSQEDSGKKMYTPIFGNTILPNMKNKSCGSGTTETVGVYEKIPNSISFDNCINSAIVYKKSKFSRYGIIFMYKNIKIANMHLEGGRYTDKILLEDFEKILSFKLSLLEDIIKQNPDIILGDFNSVYSTNKKRLNSFLEDQYNYFENVVINDKLTKKDKSNIKKWNLAPFILLKKHGYTYAKPDNANTMITNGRGNSIIDFIFYRKDKIRLEKSTIIDILNKEDNYAAYNCISDHNPIYSMFRII